MDFTYNSIPNVILLCKSTPKFLPSGEIIYETFEEVWDCKELAKSTDPRRCIQNCKHTKTLVFLPFFQLFKGQFWAMNWRLAAEAEPAKLRNMHLV